MANEREYVIISRDGTILRGDDCIIFHANTEQVDALEDTSDNERFYIIRAFENATTIDEIMYIVMKEQ